MLQPTIDAANARLPRCLVFSCLMVFGIVFFFIYSIRLIPIFLVVVLSLEPLMVFLKPVQYLMPLIILPLIALLLYHYIIITNNVMNPPSHCPRWRIYSARLLFCVDLSLGLVYFRLAQEFSERKLSAIAAYTLLYSLPATCLFLLCMPLYFRPNCETRVAGASEMEGPEEVDENQVPMANPVL